jgi:hypothetical protein
VAKKVAEEEAWRDVQFAVFGAPLADRVFTSGEIKNSNMVLFVNQVEIMRFIQGRAEAGAVEELVYFPPDDFTFEQELNYLQSALPQDDLVYLHRHDLLSGDRAKAELSMGHFMSEVLNEGGEGIMLRDPQAIWTPKRVSSLLKLKPFTDDQGTLVGFVSGRQTNKGSKLRGLIGAMILDYKGKRLEMSGFTDEERRFADEEMTSHAYNNPGEEMPPHFQGLHFSVGDTIEFRYRELSDDRIPKEARFLRHV